MWWMRNYEILGHFLARVKQSLHFLDNFGTWYIQNTSFVMNFRNFDNLSPFDWFFKFKRLNNLKSHLETINVLQAPNLCLLSHIMPDLDKNFQEKAPLATTNIIFDVQLDPFLQVSSQEQSTSSKPPFNKKLFTGQSSGGLSLSLHQSKLVQSHSSADLSFFLVTLVNGQS